MRGEDNRVQFEMVVVYAGTSAVRISGYAKVRHSARVLVRLSTKTI
jgi:hypothetical protein